jgi:hypothetical protein
MNRASTIGLWLVTCALAILGPPEASAQVSPSSSGTAMPPASMLANPYLNPYMNPYMNPLATQQPMNASNALLYLYAANSANGGIGSGRVSGTRGAPARPKPAEMPNSAHPGGGAARYFNPGPGAGGGAGRYYNQRGRYFQNNGR